MYKLFVHEDAEADLEQLWTDCPTAAADIQVFLEEAPGDQDLLDRLTQHGFGERDRDDINVSKWLEQWKKGNDLWRVKIWSLERQGLRYRIIYAFVPKKRHYYVLAVTPRDFNYDGNHEITQRILRALDGL